MIVIINYGMGNIYSIQSALAYLGCESTFSADHEKILNASHIILPGVGSYKRAMEILHNKGLVKILNEAVHEKHLPMLGICLGMQLLGLSSTEDGFTEGLGFINCKVDKFVTNDIEKIKIPHVGFNNVTCMKTNSVLLKDLNNNSDFYFTHSYKMECEDDSCVGSCNIGEKFAACVEKSNVYGTQFHPEKSQANGLKLLVNFLEQR
jgi:imidazole glycerol-phosphate synthase subunit HisH